MNAIQIEKSLDPNVILNARMDRLEMNLLQLTLQLTKAMELHRDLVRALLMSNAQPKEGERAN